MSIPARSFGAARFWSQVERLDQLGLIILILENSHKWHSKVADKSMSEASGRGVPSHQCISSS
jgi:hypothetical protein